MNNLNVKPLTIRCDEMILAKVKSIAKTNRRSMNSQIEEFLAVGVSEFEKNNGSISVEIAEE